MNLTMDYSACDVVLDLRKTKEVNHHPLNSFKYSSSTSPPQTYLPLTPPYYSPSAHYQTSLPVPVIESSDDASEMSSNSPPNMVSSTYLLTNNVINSSRTGKPTRPFKAYPKDPLALSTAPSVILGQDSTEEYIEFRQRMLAQLDMVTSRNNANMKRCISPQMPTSTAEMDDKTAAYWERRRKNNEAAKRSRDARRAKEDEIAIRAAFLEQENIKLKYELASLRNETAKLRCLVYNR